MTLVPFNDVKININLEYKMKPTLNAASDAEDTTLILQYHLEQMEVMHYRIDKSLLLHRMSLEHQHTCNMYQTLKSIQVGIFLHPKLSDYSCEVEGTELRGGLGRLE